MFIDGTHIKANANTKKQIKEQVPVASRHYAKELMAEVNADREAHGKKPFDDDAPPTAPKKRRDNTSRKKLARRKKEKTRTVTKAYPEIKVIVADSAYKTPHICKKVFGDGRVLSTAYKRPQTMKGGHEWRKYVYDEFTETWPR